MLTRRLPCAGDVVVVPAQWGHSTKSIGGFTLGVGVLWCDQRAAALSLPCHIPSAQSIYKREAGRDAKEGSRVVGRAAGRGSRRGRGR